MNYELVALIGGQLVVAFLMYNHGVTKIMATLQEVKDSLTKLAGDVGTIPVPAATAADLDAVKASIDEIDKVAVSKGAPTP